MKLWKLYRNDYVDYDEFSSFVVRAETPEAAFAMVEWGDGRPTFNDITFEEVSPEGEPEIILGSFNAG